MNAKTQELINLLKNDEVDFIDTSDRRALRLNAKYGSKDILCFGIIVPKEYNHEMCGYYFDKGLKLYLKDK